MVKKVKNPLAQALGLVFQRTRDKMGGVSSSRIASSLGLAASHYRMIEAGSALLQPARAIKVVQVFETIEFIPLCQVLVSIQILDSVRGSIDDMKTTAEFLTQADPAIGKTLALFEDLWEVIESGQAGRVARKIVSVGIVDELESFLTTEPVALTAEAIDNFMTPTYQYPITGQLYSKIGDILQGVAPFYLDVILELIDNLRGIAPRVTPGELAQWEQRHRNRFSHVIGIVRKPEVILDVDTFDYSFLWQDNFQKMLIIHRDSPKVKTESILSKLADNLKRRYESERIKYERQLLGFDETINRKLSIEYRKEQAAEIDALLRHRETQMNNLWVYI
ncbi:MAG TPA: hypothetical protein HPP51_05390, partial [Planctomycetes bacterium]|nr:hypothetical protein [Planctomycetota bacterium]